MNVSAATIQYKVEAPSRTFTSCLSLTQITHDPLLSTTAGSVHRSIRRDLGLRMGSVFSRAKIILGAVVLLNKALDTLNERLKESPGLHMNYFQQRGLRPQVITGGGAANDMSPGTSVYACGVTVDNEYVTSG